MRKVIYLNNLRSICSSCPREIADPGRLDNATNENNAENSWCGRGDLNPHAFRRHPLKMVCLPVPPLPHFVKLLATYILASSFCEGTSSSTEFLHATRSSGRSKSASRAKQLVYCRLPRVHVARCDLDVIVS